MKSIPAIFAVMGFLAEPVAAEAEIYGRDIKPLLQARCYACHGALKQKAGLRLDTGEAIRRGSKNGLILATNDPASSSLLLRVGSTDRDQRMPPDGEPLTPGQIQMLQSWIARGAPSPVDEKPEPDPSEHWAFRPVKRPKVPLIEVSEKNLPTSNPIDAFIAKEFEGRGLVPQPESRRDLLLRRVYLDLIGLPPSRDELHAFLADTAPDAYERVVERLLESPRHGERWARHWMDIWRYADWYGRRHVPDVWNSAPQVWRWREWIVRAINSDKGYDRMLVEMLAADEAAPEDEQARPATGYLVRNWYALNPNQWMRDVVEHTGKAFMGLTFNCAHCHDHKYDPISHRDYFQFRAFFEPIQVRQDRFPGESDPGPFQKYEYSANRKVVTQGVVSVFDENPAAKTFIYLRGDERTFPEGKPAVNPAMPSFLGGHLLRMEPLALPPPAFYPGVRPPIRQTMLEEHVRAKEAARRDFDAVSVKYVEARSVFMSQKETNNLSSLGKVLAEILATEVDWRNASNKLAVANAAHSSLQARMAADDARYGHSSRPNSGGTHNGKPYALKGTPDQGSSSSPADPALSAEESASRAERELLLRQAQAQFTLADGKLSLLEAEHSLSRARWNVDGASKHKEESDKADAAVKKARDSLATARKSIESAEAALLTNSRSYASLTPVYPSTTTGRRLALATWLTRPDHPLTARVAVNHIWNRHFHAPLVASVFDFGRNGAKPTHSELLDWLAAEFMDHGWSMKHLHRIIVTSRAYRRSSASPAEVSESASCLDVASESSSAAPGRTSEIGSNQERDPENRYLWRMNSGQMEAEVLRDSLLHLAGELDVTPVDYPLPTKDAESSRRRSLYFECFPEPGGHSQFASAFDPPEPMECYRRTSSIMPQQALAMSNSRLAREQSRTLSKKLASSLGDADSSAAASFVTLAFEHLLSRPPSSEESVACQNFLQKAFANPPETASIPVKNDPPSDSGSFARAHASLVHALINHNDFVTIR